MRTSDISKTIKIKEINFLFLLGATSIEKIHKSSASCQNFVDPSTLFEKGPTDENFGFSYLIVTKFRIFKISTPQSPISFYQSRWPLSRYRKLILKCSHCCILYVDLGCKSRKWIIFTQFVWYMYLMYSCIGVNFTFIYQGSIWS